MRMLFVFVLATVGAMAAISQEATKLVTIKLEGTTIDQFPDEVVLLCDSPSTQAKAMLEKGGTIEPGSPITVRFKGGRFIFSKPDEFVGVTPQPKAGDTVYVFHFNSTAKRDQFLSTFKLKITSKAKLNERRRPLYRASDRFYVLALALQPSGEHLCTMHPDFRAKKAGTCPICGLDLIEGKAYR